MQDQHAHRRRPPAGVVVLLGSQPLFGGRAVKVHQRSKNRRFGRDVRVGGTGSVLQARRKLQSLELSDTKVYEP